MDLRRAYRPNVDGDGPIMALCPIHGDRNPSLAIYQDGVWCFGCGFRQDAESFLQQHPPGSLEIRYQSRGSSHHGSGSGTGKTKSPYLPLSMVRTYHQWLMTGRFNHRKAWLYERGLTEETLERHLLGHSLSAFVIPVISVLGQLRTVRYRRDDAYWEGDGGAKYWGTPGANETLLYLADNLLSGGEVFLCEGELDALLLHQYGLPAVSCTNGNKGLPASLAPSLRGRRVHICYDQDEPDQNGRRAGYEGAKRVLEMIGPPAHIVTWDIQFGKDVTEVLKVIDLQTFLRIARTDVQGE